MMLERRRLAAYRATHPEIWIGAHGHFPGHEDWWQAQIPEGIVPGDEDREAVYTAYTLRELLDKLDGLHIPAGIPPP